MNRKFLQLTTLLLLCCLILAQHGDNDNQQVPVSCKCETPSSNGMACMKAKCAVDSASCFPADAIVHVLGKGETPIKDLTSGDQLLTMDSETGALLHTEFLDWLHINETQPMKFLKFLTENGKSLEVSPDHQIFTKEHGSILARNAKISQDSLPLASPDSTRKIYSKIVAISEVQKIGVYSPLTWSGDLVVNGVYVSNYAHIDSFAVANGVMWPAKVMSKVLGMGWMVGARNEDGVMRYAEGWK
jgi:desert hedgehog protein